MFINHDAKVSIILVYTKFINVVYVFSMYTDIILRSICFSVYIIKLCYIFGVHYIL